MEDTLNLLSIGQASEYLGVSIDTLRRWEKKAKIVSYRSPGGHRYFKKEELDMMFGKKYERSEETKPRKEYELNNKSESTEVLAVEKLEIIGTDQEDDDQKIVDAIISEEENAKSEIEDFFARQPKEISIPKLEPVRVVGGTSDPVLSPISTSIQPTAATTLEPKLFTSFSQVQAPPKRFATKQIITPQVAMVMVAVVVLITAAIFIVLYFAAQPNLVSPI